jgi:hypothetical protein
VAVEDGMCGTRRCSKCGWMTNFGACCF